jgi:tricorn protease
MLRALTAALACSLSFAVAADGYVGYYRDPALRGDVLVFAAEGDLWTVDASGGDARRLTTHDGDELHPALSPDGSTVAFCAQYEGPTEVYTIDLDGGVPIRRTYGAERVKVVDWVGNHRILYATSEHTQWRDLQLVELDIRTGVTRLLPLAQASDGALAPDGTLFFTRFRFQGSHTKRYKGGTARSIWKFGSGMDEAVELTGDYDGESYAPMWYDGRVYFLTDRDGTMNIWSMDPDGGDLTQHTSYAGWDVKSPTLDDGRIVFQLGADLHLLEIGNPPARVLPITLATDLDRMRERWVTNPMSYLTAAHPSPDGDRVVLTARGEIFVAPAENRRFIQIARNSGVRYRQAQFDPDGASIITLSDATGETEFWTVAANGLEDPEQITDDATVLRYDPLVSPDGRYIAWQDKDWKLWIHDLEADETILVAESHSPWEGFDDLQWSPDSRWLAFVQAARNTYQQIQLFSVADRATTAITSDRVNSWSPSFTADGTWLYFISERHFETLVGSPWGSYQPEPFLHNLAKIYAVSLVGETRSPFRPLDELEIAEKKADAADEEPDEEDADAQEESESNDALDELFGDQQEDSSEADAGDEAGDDEEPIELVLDGVQHRVIEVPIPAGNHRSLSVGEKHIFWISSNTAPPRNPRLQALEITNEKKPKITTIAEGIGSYELTLDRKKMLVRKANDLSIVSANGSKVDLGKGKIDLSRWRFPLDPREEWRQIFIEAWRLERDYFYDPGLHGVDWDRMLEKYLPLVDRVTTRYELSDLLAQMVGELTALHIFVVGGDQEGPDQRIGQGALGADFERDDDAGGWRIAHIFRTDPDYPGERSPLADPDLDVSEGDVITHINGAATLAVPDLGVLLRDQYGRQVRLGVKPAAGGEPRDVIVTATGAFQQREMRYDEWEYTRRLRVEELGDGEIGYVHLRAMGSRNFLEWVRNFYPVFNRRGLIVDVRHNSGGNIDSWILNRLIRRAWMYWKDRAGEPYWNMHYAFRGHMVVLCDESTASDGEAFTEGFRRLGLGKVIGTRTWGGEIWLSFSNRLVDSGIASAAEAGVYGPEGEWLIENIGVIPDIEVDNLPHATFNGADAQLDAAIAHLLKLIAEDPRDVPPPPPYPDKSFGNE